MGKNEIIPIPFVQQNKAESPIKSVRFGVGFLRGKLYRFVRESSGEHPHSVRGGGLSKAPALFPFIYIIAPADGVAIAEPAKQTYKTDGLPVRNYQAGKIVIRIQICPADRKTCGIDKRLLLRGDAAAKHGVRKFLLRPYRTETDFFAFAAKYLRRQGKQFFEESAQIFRVILRFLRLFRLPARSSSQRPSPQGRRCCKRGRYWNRGCYSRSVPRCAQAGTA